MTTDTAIRHAWQDDSAPAPLPALDTLKSRSDTLRRKIKRRNALEYGAGALVVLAFGAMLVLGPLPGVRLAAALVILGTVYIMWQLHRRGSALAEEEHKGALPLLDYQRRELVRQRDALRSIFSWYLAPLLPGVALFFVAPLLSMPVSEWVIPPLSAWGSLGFVVAVFTAIWFANHAAARKLQEEIDAIDALKSA